MPLADQKLVIEPNYPGGVELAKIGRDEGDPLPDGVTLRNNFWSNRLRAEVYIWNEPDGSVRWNALPVPHGFTMLVQTLGCSEAWGIEQEHRALMLLGTLLPHRHFKQYLLTGMFLETSPRSGLTYLFRKLRPTVVIDARDSGAKASRILCCLCLHPIAYYSDTWAGAMTPTDEVVGHLMLMRGDEPLFWRRANQHPPDRPQAGL